MKHDTALIFPQFNRRKVMDSDEDDALLNLSRDWN